MEPEGSLPYSPVPAAEAFLNGS